MEIQSEAEKIKQAIQSLEGQRQLLGDAVVETALSPLREKLASLLPQGLSEQRKFVTVLFADLAGFTSLSSRMDPEEVREIINSYFQLWSACIKRQEGVVEKYIGDAVLAVFGLPASHEDDPERSIRAALEMQKELVQFNDALAKKHGLRLSMRVGINTGEVVASLLGERQGEEFIVIGDMVNLASRLQSAAPVDGILITHDTYRHVRGLFETSLFGPLQIKGVENPVQAYWVKAARPRSFRLGNRGIEGVETPMIGREAEFNLLRGVFQQVLERKDRQVILLSGEAGLGKSRLLFEFENWLDLLPERVNYFRGRGSSTTQYQPYSLIRDLFTFRCKIQDSDPPAVVQEKLEENAREVFEGSQAGPLKIHFIARLLGFEMGESEHLRGAEGDSKVLHDQALVYLGDYFRAVGDARPSVILLEDLHWADNSSLALLHHLEKNLEGLPFLIVYTARPALFERMPSLGEEHPYHSRIVLKPLDREPSRLLVEEILKKVGSLPPTLLDLVVNTADGNPFFLEELIKMLVEDEVIVKTGDQWKVEEDLLGKLRVPPTLTEVLQARFDSLEPAQRRSLQLGAVIGRVFWDRALGALGYSPTSQEEKDRPASLADSLAQLCSREMIFRREISSFASTNEYLFKHALLRDVTYSSLLKRDRRVYHGRVARWLEEVCGRTRRSAEFAMLIAEHYENAGENGPAAEWYLRAGRTAAARFANQEALRALSKAIELSSEPDPHWMFSALSEREKVFGLLGRRAEQRSDLDAMQAAAVEAGESSLIARAALRMAQYHLLTADYPGVIESAQLAEQLALAMHDQELAARSALLQASAVMRQGKMIQAGAHARRALLLAAQQDQPEVQAEAYRQLGLVFYYTGDAQQAQENFAKALDLYQQARNRPGEALLLNNLGGTVFEIGEYKQAATYYARSLEICHMIGDRLGESRSLNNLGITSVIRGEYAEAEDYYLQGLKITREVGHRGNEMSALDNLGNLAFYRYNYTQAVKYHLDALEGTRAIGDRVTESFILINLGRDYLATGDFERALEILLECTALTQELGDRKGSCLSLIYQSICLAVTGKVPSALELCEQAVTLAKDLQLSAEIGSANYTKGTILLDKRNFPEAVECFAQALECWQDPGDSNEKMSTLAGLGSAALGLGDLPRAIESIEPVLAYLKENGVEGFESPARIFISCYQVLSAAQDPRGPQVLQQGYSLLQENASKIETESMRRTYLECVLENQALMKAWQKKNASR